MTKLLIFFIFVFVCISSLEAVPKRDRNDYTKKPYRLVCYFGSWANYHLAEPFVIEDIDPNLCTHINYGFARLDEYTYKMVPFDPWLDTDHYHAYKRFVDLRKQNPTLTTLIALGGWWEGSEKYSDMARDPNLRKEFVKSAVDFLIQYDFDGLDVDWEYPANRRGDPKKDPENYIALLTELKAAFEPHGFLLTSAVSPGKKTMDSAYNNVPKLNELLDIINVMAYDYHGGWEDNLGHNAPFVNRPDETDELSLVFNINYTIHYWLQLGADPKKMVMGIPFYGRAWTLSTKDKVHLHDPAKGMSPASFISGEEGILGYNEICQFEKNDSTQWTVKYDPYYQAPYAYNESIWVAYDDVKSIACKVTFLKQMGLSGGMVWSLETDDFKGRCQNEKYPLLHKVHSMLNGDEKASFECPIAGPVPTTTTPKPTPSPTQPTTQPSTQPSTSESTGTPFATSVLPNGHVIKCFKAGLIEHPTDVHKYVVCEYISSGIGMGWWIHIMDCAPGTKWNQTVQDSSGKGCVSDPESNPTDPPTQSSTQSPTTPPTQPPTTPPTQPLTTPPTQPPTTPPTQPPTQPPTTPPTQTISTTTLEPFNK